MRICYDKLFERLGKAGMKKNDLRNIYGIPPAVVNRLAKNENVNTSTIVKLCTLLKCQPGDIMEVK